MIRGLFFFFQAEDGIRARTVTGVQTCALPILSIETGLPLVLVRKEPKGYGTAKQLEGRFRAGERITVIEDVVTTGGDSLRSIEALRAAALDVIHLVVVLDRGEGGEENIREARIPYSPLFRIQDLTLD